MGFMETPIENVLRIVRVLRVVLVNKHHLVLVGSALEDLEELRVLALGRQKIHFCLLLGVELFFGRSFRLFRFAFRLNRAEGVAEVGVVLGVADHALRHERF